MSAETNSQPDRDSKEAVIPRSPKLDQETFEKIQFEQERIHALKCQTSNDSAERKTKGVCHTQPNR